jgi:hypothetical protein
VVVVVVGTIQSKIASKSKTLQGDVVVVVVVGQLPETKKDSSKSGQLEKELVTPNCKQTPSRTLDKHHLLPSVE